MTWNKNFTFTQRLKGLVQPYAVADWTGQGGLTTPFTTRRRAVKCAEAHNLDVARLSITMRTGTSTGQPIDQHLTPVLTPALKTWHGWRFSRRDSDEETRAG